MIQDAILTSITYTFQFKHTQTLWVIAVDHIMLWTLPSATIAYAIAAAVSQPPTATLFYHVDLLQKLL